MSEFERNRIEEQAQKLFGKISNRVHTRFVRIARCIPRSNMTDEELTISWLEEELEELENKLKQLGVNL